jgi:hypothetical protein
LIHLDSVEFWDAMAVQQVNKQHADPCFCGRVRFANWQWHLQACVSEISMIDRFVPVAMRFDFVADLG